MVPATWDDGVFNDWERLLGIWTKANWGALASGQVTEADNVPCLSPIAYCAPTILKFDFDGFELAYTPIGDVPNGLEGDTFPVASKNKGDTSNIIKTLGELPQFWGDPGIFYDLAGWLYYQIYGLVGHVLVEWTQDIINLSETVFKSGAFVPSLSDILNSLDSILNDKDTILNDGVVEKVRCYLQGLYACLVEATKITETTGCCKDRPIREKLNLRILHNQSVELMDNVFDLYGDEEIGDDDSSQFAKFTGDSLITQGI